MALTALTTFISSHTKWQVCENEQQLFLIDFFFGGEKYCFVAATVFCVTSVAGVAVAFAVLTSLDFSRFQCGCGGSLLGWRLAGFDSLISLCHVLF